jgi:hypothetical protein
MWRIKKAIPIAASHELGYAVPDVAATSATIEGSMPKSPSVPTLGEKASAIPLRGSARKNPPETDRRRLMVRRNVAEDASERGAVLRGFLYLSLPLA